MSRRPSAQITGDSPALGPVLPILAEVDRISRVTVCLRPFRAAGPRMDVERVGDKTVIHNYGHGGSGWSLSWGAAQVALRSALTSLDGQRELAVIGCGALGLTAALTAQRAGLRVTIYARELPPNVRSSRATGSWTPDSRIALASAASAAFPAQWEAMARASFATYQTHLDMPGQPIEWTDRYLLSDIPWEQELGRREQEDRHGFAHYVQRIADITPPNRLLPAGATPFPTRYVNHTTTMTFNVADYSRQLIEDFQSAGGLIQTREFDSPGDLASLPQSVLINCTGYGARQLWSDESIVPVRSQIAWLTPQPEINYGIYFGDLIVLGRREGIVVQPSPGGENFGWNDDNEQPDLAAAEQGVRDVASIYSRHPRP